MPLFFFPLLIPYYTDRQASMRIPFVTFGLMLVCIGMLVLTYRGEKAAERTFLGALDDAVQYAVRSPDVDERELRQFCAEIGEPGCIDVVANDPLREAATQFQALMGAITGLLVEEEDPIPAAQQQELDRRVERAREAYLARPYVRFGLSRGAFRPHALLTHQFLHAGLLHLLANLLFLWLVMSSLENVWGRWFVLGFFLVCGVAAGVIELLFMGETPLSPLIGASGAVAGLMGAYLVRFLRSRIRMWYFMWFFAFVRTGTFFWPAWVALPLWLAWQVVQWWWLGDDGVAYAAHVGGFVLGVAGALLVTRTGFEARFLPSEPEEEEASPLRVQAESAAQRGEWTTAVRLYRKLADANPYDDELQVSLARALAEVGEQDQADGILRRTVQRLLEQGNVELAAQRYQDMGQITGSVELNPAAMVAIGDWFAERSQDHYALYTYERYLEFHTDDSQRLRVLLASVELLQHQREGRVQAEEMLAEAEDLASQGGTVGDRGRIEVLRTALHQVPQGTPLTGPAGGRRRKIAVQSEELERNVEDWVQTPAPESAPMPAKPLVGAALPSSDSSLAPKGGGELESHPWTPPGTRDPATSGEWGAANSKIIPPMEDEAGDDGGASAGEASVPEALRSRILTPRMSALMAIEPDRLRCETAGGAPFKLPLERISWVAVGRIWYEDEAGGLESYVCDLIHGVHRTPSRVVVETVRLLSDRQPFGLLLQDAGMDEGNNFRRLLDQLRPLLDEAHFIPPRTGQGGDIPTFAGLDDYERAMMFRIVGER